MMIHVVTKVVNTVKGPRVSMKKYHYTNTSITFEVLQVMVRIIATEADNKKDNSCKYFYKSVKNSNVNKTHQNVNDINDLII